VVDTTVGHVFGFTKEKMYIDPVTLPVILAIAATILKSAWLLVLFAMFLPEKLDSFFGVSILIEMGLNALAAPFLYAILRVLKLVKDRSSTIFD
jgi:rod shape-determining protein MreD